MDIPRNSVFKPITHHTAAQDNSFAVQFIPSRILEILPCSVSDESNPVIVCKAFEERIECDSEWNFQQITSNVVILCNSSDLRT